MQRAAIRHLHLFAARDKAFKDDKVLQENMIIFLERDGQQGDVTVSTSTDSRFTDYAVHAYPFNRIVFPDDPELFVHIPTCQRRNAIEQFQAVRHSLQDIGIQVSTGPVVDFRLRGHLRDMPESNTVPLLYPAHFTAGITEWPKPQMKKPNAIQRNTETEKWLYPNGFYTVVRRFSSKEEKRRIMATVVDPKIFNHAEKLGFENHLNVFHQDKQGLPQNLAYGLATFLGMSMVDEHFRQFNGHTQVNATDLKRMKYPSREHLSILGAWAQTQHQPTQAMIEEQLTNLGNNG